MGLRQYRGEDFRSGPVSNDIPQYEVHTDCLRHRCTDSLRLHCQHPQMSSHLSPYRSQLGPELTWRLRQSTTRIPSHWYREYGNRCDYSPSPYPHDLESPIEGQ